MTSTEPSPKQVLAFRFLRIVLRLLPLGEEGRDALRQWFSPRFPSIRPPQPAPETAPIPARRAAVHAGGPAIGHAEQRIEALPDPLPARLVAFYLPQFHAIPENDAWWGKGFTEWRNVTRALPQFEGHPQPRLPADMGFYDLRDPGVMRQQAALAQAHGIHAFCFYFYWFQGKTLLEAPIAQWLDDDEITMPFCLCWANEGWSRRWDGRADDILVPQGHDAGDDIEFIAHVARYLRDPRYLRIDGKPLLLVYRPGLMPEPDRTAERWRSWCLANNVDVPLIAYVQSFETPDPREIGFDAAVEFPPNLSSPTDITRRHRLLNDAYGGQVLDWRGMAEDYGKRQLPAYRLFPGVNCGWDNEPRRPGQGRTYVHASPRRYRDWLQQTITTRLSGARAQERLVFINAWNEWAEGAVLEPDLRLGHAWLQATRTALLRCSNTTGTPAPRRPCIVVHAWHAPEFADILRALAVIGLDYRLIVTTGKEAETAIRHALEATRIRGEIEVFENRGRDIRPFLYVAGKLLDQGEDVVLKLHTKRSPHRGDGRTWRDDLLRKLVDPARSRRILDAFLADKGIGMVPPEGHVLPTRPYLGGNGENLSALRTRLGLRSSTTLAEAFVSGSMFWARLDALRPLLDAHLDDWLFEPESGQIDCTFAHAVERIFLDCILEAGYSFKTAGDICGEATDTDPQDYPFAEPD